METVKGIFIKGEYFNGGGQELALFPEKSNRLSVVFGKNGSGKTTISKALYEYSQGEIQTKGNFQEFSFLDENKKKIAGFAPQSVFVFNDIFAARNVKYDKDNLNAIAIFGKQGDLSECLEKAVEKEKSIIGELETYEGFDTFNCSDDLLSNDKVNKNSLGELRDKFVQMSQKYLDGDGVQRISPKLMSELLAPIGKNADVDAIKTALKDKSDVYKSIKGTSEGVLQQVPAYDCSAAEDAFSLLAKSLNKPINDDISKRISDLLKNGDFTYPNTKKVVDEGMPFCPTCLRPIDDSYRELLKNAVNVVFNKDANDLQRKLSALNIDLEPEIDQSLFSKLSMNYAEYSAVYKDFSDLIDKLKGSIHQKVKNPFDTISFDKGDFLSAAQNYNDIISKINNIIQRINSLRNKKAKLRDEISDLIEQVFKIEHKQEISQIRSHQQELRSRFGKYRQLRGDLAEVRREIGSISAEIDNFSIGLNEMNDDLAYIFGSKERLQLVPYDDRGVTFYAATSRGCQVKLENLSSGEQNIIALVYFVSTIKRGKKEGEYFNEPLFVVIDDPISSFDASNRFGVSSFLEAIIKQVLKGNADSRFVVLTHDVTTMQMLTSINIVDKQHKVAVPLLLKNKQLNTFGRKKNLYVLLTKEVLDAISSYSRGIDLPPGLLNETRRIVDWFCTFEYAKGLSDVMLDEKILSNIRPRFSLTDNTEKIDLFKERLIGFTDKFLMDDIGSHSQSIAGNLQMDAVFYELDSDDQIKRIKQIILFIYYLNPTHVTSICSSLKDGNQNYIDIIEGWAKDFEDSI